MTTGDREHHGPLEPRRWMDLKSISGSARYQSYTSPRFPEKSVLSQ